MPMFLKNYNIQVSIPKLNKSVVSTIYYNENEHQKAKCTTHRVSQLLDLTSQGGKAHFKIIPQKNFNRSPKNKKKKKCYQPSEIKTVVLTNSKQTNETLRFPVTERSTESETDLVLVALVEVVPVLGGFSLVVFFQGLTFATLSSDHRWMRLAMAAMDGGD
ncbi:hypothetical protein ACOSQ2_020400 [Xanthoceras sorbifolium]